MEEPAEELYLIILAPQVPNREIMEDVGVVIVQVILRVKALMVLQAQVVGAMADDIQAVIAVTATGVAVAVAHTEAVAEPVNIVAADMLVTKLIDHLHVVAVSYPRLAVEV